LVSHYYRLVSHYCRLVRLSFQSFDIESY
jgi:hypothetical protein